MQEDGNLVVYDTDYSPKWNSGTNGMPSVELHLQNDGNLVLYSKNGNSLSAVWNAMQDVRWVKHPTGSTGRTRTCHWETILEYNYDTETYTYRREWICD